MGIALEIAGVVVGILGWLKVPNTGKDWQTSLVVAGIPLLMIAAGEILRRIEKIQSALAASGPKSAPPQG